MRTTEYNYISEGKVEMDTIREEYNMKAEEISEELAQCRKKYRQNITLTDWLLNGGVDRCHGMIRTQIQQLYADEKKSMTEEIEKLKVKRLHLDCEYLSKLTAYMTTKKRKKGIKKEQAVYLWNQAMSKHNPWSVEAQVEYEKLQTMFLKMPK